MCGNVATYYKEIHEKGDSLYYCEDCVPRVSTDGILNIDDWGEPIENTKVMWWDENAHLSDLLKDGSLERTKNSFYYEYIDENNKRAPNKKFMHDENGFPKEDKIKMLHQIQILSAYSKQLNYCSKFEAQKIGTEISNILLDKKSCELKTEIPYNTFMSKLGNMFKTLKLTVAYKNNYQKFYKNFKKELEFSKSK